MTDVPRERIRYAAVNRAGNGFVITCCLTSGGYEMWVATNYDSLGEIMRSLFAQREALT